MNTIRFTHFLTGTFVVSAALLASCSSDWARPTHNLVNENGEPLICEDIEITGTRFTEEICRTEEEWAAVSSRNRTTSDEYSRQSNQNSGIVGDPTAPGGVTSGAMGGAGGAVPY